MHYEDFKTWDFAMNSPVLYSRVKASLAVVTDMADHLVFDVDGQRKAAGGRPEQIVELLEISEHIRNCMPQMVDDPAHAIKLVALLVQRLANHHEADAADAKAAAAKALPTIADLPCETISDLLLLVGVTRSPAEIQEWTDEQRDAAYKWAAATHLSAADSLAEVPERPDFLTDDDDEEGPQ